MPVYQTETSVSRPITYRPVREVRLTKAGQLIAAAGARYGSLTEYVAQFGAPLSSLKGNGLWSFADPIEQVSLVVECEPCAWCTRCDRSLDACDCAF
jgi:hypothetical protein